jgi:hypothetical protein
MNLSEQGGATAIKGVGTFPLHHLLELMIHDTEPDVSNQAEPADDNTGGVKRKHHGQIQDPWYMPGPCKLWAGGVNFGVRKFRDKSLSLILLLVLLCLALFVLVHIFSKGEN